MTNESDRPEEQPANEPSPRFAEGDTVRVRSGATDPNYPDIPLGGYTGTIDEVDPDNDPPLYLLVWDDHTLEQMPEVLKQRSERDGFDFETMWLDESDLEPATGALVPIQQPTELIPDERFPEALDEEEAEARLREIFGLGEDDPVPEITPETLRIFYEYLEARLEFPCPGMLVSGFEENQPHIDPITVLGLRPDDEADAELGLLATVEREGYEETVPLLHIFLPREAPGQLALVDYTSWFSLMGGFDGGFDWQPPFPTTRAGFAFLVVRFVVYAAGFGAVMGAMLEALESASTAMLIGAGVLGLLGFFIYSRLQAMSTVGVPTGPVGGTPVVGGLLGALLGGLLGALLGVLMIGVLGTLPGAMLGSLLGKGLALTGFRPLGELGWALFGAFAGGLALALYTNQTAALAGARMGALVGGGIVLGLALVLLAVSLSMRRPDPHD